MPPAPKPSDLEQAVWLRLLERLDSDGPPADPQNWLRRAVRSEARRNRRTARLERPYDDRARRRRRTGPRAARPHGRPAPRPARRGAPAARPLPEPAGGAAVAEGPHIPGNRGGVGYLTGESWSGTFQMPGMSPSIADAGGCGSRSAGIGVRTTTEQVSGRHAHMGMSVTISAATEQDAEQIFRLQYLCFQSEAELCTATTGSIRSSRPSDSVRDEVGADCVFVARLGEEVVGSVRGTPTPTARRRIGKLCVHPRLQRPRPRRPPPARGRVGARGGTRRQEVPPQHGPPQRKEPAPVPPGRLRDGGHRQGHRRRTDDRPGEAGGNLRGNCLTAVRAPRQGRGELRDQPRRTRGRAANLSRPAPAAHAHCAARTSR